MNKSLLKCNLIWLLLTSIIGFTGMATLKPDITKEWLTKNTSGFVDMFNLRSGPKTTKESYIKRDRAYDETSAFEEAQ